MNGEEVAKLMQNIGGETICPRCGEKGRVAVDKFRARGHVYFYLVVRHPKGRSRVKRCLIKRLTEEEATKLAAKQEGEKLGGFATQEEIAKLKRRVEELEKENEELRRQLEGLQAVEGWVKAARAHSLVLSREDFEALKAYYIRKKGYTPEQKDLAKNLMAEFVDRGLERGVATVVFCRLP